MGATGGTPPVHVIRRSIARAAYRPWHPAIWNLLPANWNSLPANSNLLPKLLARSASEGIDVFKLHQSPETNALRRHPFATPSLALRANMRIEQMGHPEYPVKRRPLVEQSSGIF